MWVNLFKLNRLISFGFSVRTKRPNEWYIRNWNWMCKINTKRSRLKIIITTYDDVAVAVG